MNLRYSICKTLVIILEPQFQYKFTFFLKLLVIIATESIYCKFSKKKERQQKSLSLCL